MTGSIPDRNFGTFWHLNVTIVCNHRSFSMLPLDRPRLWLSFVIIHVLCGLFSISAVVFVLCDSVVLGLVLPILSQEVCLQCFDAVGWRQEGHPACKKLEWWSAGVVICLEQGADLHMSQLMPLPLVVSCFSKIQIGFTLYRLTRVVPDKGPLNGCVCVCY